ncbi:unnamed protein product, partial [Laminaria digitata]
GGEAASLTIESDRLIPGQEIEYYGTENEPYIYVRPEVTGVKKKERSNDITLRNHGNFYELKSTAGSGFTELVVVDLNGRLVYQMGQDMPSRQLMIDKAIFSTYPSGIYVLKTNVGITKVFVD